MSRRRRNSAPQAGSTASPAASGAETRRAPEQAGDRPSGLPSRPYLALAALCALVYARNLTFGFTYLDDHVLILQRREALSHWYYALQAFREDAFGASVGRFYYRPLLTLSYLLDTKIAGISPSFYHLTNVLLHLLAVCLLHRFWRRAGLAAGPALLLASLFAVHPALTQTVALLDCRNEPLFAIFTLLSCRFFLDYIGWREPAPPERGWRRLAGHLLFFAMALLTKETAVVIPAVCLYLSWSAGRAAKAARAAAGWAPLAAAWWLVRSRVLDNPEASRLAAVPAAVLHNLPMLLAYLGRFFFPVHLSTYPYMDPAILGAGVAAAALLAALLALSRATDRTLVAAGAVWFVAFSLPFLAKPGDGISPTDMLENRAYVPAMGLGLVLGGLDFGLSPSAATGLYGLGAALVAVFSGVTAANGAHYKNRLSFWENAAAAPRTSAFVLNNLGAMYYLDNRTGEAEREWRKAAALNPYERLVHNNLGLIDMARGDLDAAEREFELELRLNPQYDNAHLNLGLLFYKRGNLAAAESSWKRAVEINPNMPEAYYDLIAVCFAQGKREQARRYIRTLRDRGVPYPPLRGA